jgi:hypothetical protein
MLPLIAHICNREPFILKYRKQYRQSGVSRTVAALAKDIWGSKHKTSCSRGKRLKNFYFKPCKKMPSLILYRLEGGTPPLPPPPLLVCSYATAHTYLRSYVKEAYYKALGSTDRSVYENLCWSLIFLGWILDKFR